MFEFPSKNIPRESSSISIFPRLPCVINGIVSESSGDQSATCEGKAKVLDENSVVKFAFSLSELAKLKMSGVFLRTLNSQWIQLEKNASYSYDSIVEELKTFHGLQAASIPIKFYNGCQEIAAGASFPWPENDVFINTSIGLAGGKGGFGSMLR